MTNNYEKLTNARKAKKDEFYTQYCDIEKEMAYYVDHFSGKIVYCNCDNPETSEFVHYFIDNFDTLRLKSLIATSYSGDEPSLLEPMRKGKLLRLTEAIAYEDVASHVVELEGNGSFKSRECLAFLKEADIVVTNPPFSLFRDFVDLMMDNGKSFIILGNVNAVSCRGIFSLFQRNLLWFGASIHTGGREFKVPDSYPLYATGIRVDSDGNKYIRVSGVRWFTNMSFEETKSILSLERAYSPEDYPKYDTYDAIEVGRVNDIPYDYDGVMGVPITFLDKYNPDQFEIIGLERYTLPREILSEGRLIIRGKKCYARILIRRRQES